MKVGTTLRIQIKESKVRFASELIGIEDGKYLIIKTPPIYSALNASSLINKRNNIFVRYIHKGSVFGFQSHIIDVIINPAKLIFIEYPKIVKDYNLRENIRIDCFLPANMIIAENMIEGSITDISRKGCQFVVETSKLENDIKSAEINNEICLNFQLPGVEKELAVTAKHRIICKDNDKVNIGIEFINMDTEAQMKLYDFLSIAGV
ncbi:MAG: flagellar brake domain-containing protein [Candidatus Scalinduaceae bacterium]